MDFRNERLLLRRPQHQYRKLRRRAKAAEDWTEASGWRWSGDSLGWQTEQGAQHTSQSSYAKAREETVPENGGTEAGCCQQSPTAAACWVLAERAGGRCSTESLIVERGPWGRD